MRIRHKEGNIEYLTFESLDRLGIVTDIFTTRKGGVSTGYHASMNLAFTNGDEYEDVMDNYRIIAPVIGVELDHIVRTHQTHTTNVVRVTEDMVYDDGALHDAPGSDIDGLITNIKGVALATFYADCVPLYFVDPVHEAIGLSHSGWRGTVAGMGRVTIKAMQEAFGTDPADLYTAIGPSICIDHYEVSEAVAREFMKAFPGDTDKIMKPGAEAGKYQLDLWEANRLLMIQSGVKEDHIEVSGMCTYSDPETFFSHRASNGKRGNMAAFLKLNTLG